MKLRLVTCALCLFAGILQRQPAFAANIEHPAAQDDRPAKNRVRVSATQNGRVRITMDNSGGMDSSVSQNADPVHVMLLAVEDSALFDGALTRANTDAISSAIPHTMIGPSAGKKLPAAPLNILRDGRYRGQRLVTLAVSPMFSRNGVKRITSLDATLDGARLVEDATAVLDAQPARSDGASAIPNPPPNALAASSTSRIVRVTASGLHRLTPSVLSAAGLQASTVCVTYKGAALHVHEPGDGSVIFYAGTPGDRYNTSDAYWLSGSGCARMGAAPAGAAVAPGEAPYEVGAWNEDVLYYNVQPGPAGDHWFNKQVDITSAANTIWNFQTPGAVLPAASGTAVFTVTGVTASRALYSGRLTGNGVDASTQWDGDGLFSARFSYASGNLPTQFTLTGGVRIYADRISWQRPVTLDFTAGSSRFITPRAGAYALSGVGGKVLYDISNPMQPKIVAGAGDRSVNLIAGGAYIMGGHANTQFDHNASEAYVPLTTRGGQAPNIALNKSVYYIAPNTLRDHAKLGQLIALRNSQGWSTEVVPVEALYAYWGHGQISPEAIREFLQFQYNASSVKPQAVVLVGDGDYDWRGKEDAQSGIAKATPYPRLIPPYLANVDRFNIISTISNPEPSETACEPCFAQLDGDSPLDDFIPDLIIGRLPVNGAAQLDVMADKILRYESLNADLAPGTWRNKLGYLVDNYWRPQEGQNIVPGQPLPPNPVTDGAGPFWAFADTNIFAYQAIGPTYVRNYYDPYQVMGGASHSLGAPQPGNNIPSVAGKKMINDGVSFVTYIGHSNEVRMGQFDTSDYYADGYLYDYEVKNLTNTDKLPVFLQMTCKTGSFHKHNTAANADVDKETYLDERLVLQGGNIGAIAVWSSTGLGVMYGHQPLLHGFFKTYWKNYSINAPPTVGQSAMGGYLQLFAENAENGEDSLRTYSILGDPLTRARVYAPTAVRRDVLNRLTYLPQQRKGK
jgi:hypothetical protein